ncbi:hypothetical protein ABT160_30045 [Streptomyces sp. NPDC001941]|uniref:hypothetical protein n=1 Tax=Streptomyces sp. NPDC001941 TaxID=3154659 RepID=UPI00332295B9
MPETVRRVLDVESARQALHRALRLPACGDPAALPDARRGTISTCQEPARTRTRTRWAAVRAGDALPAGER